MNWTVEYEGGIVALQIPENCPLPEYEEALFEMFERGFPKRALLENMTGQTSWPVDEVRAHFARVRRYAGNLGLEHRVAILAARPLDYGMGRMAASTLESVFPCPIAVFHERDEALAWLRRDVID